MKTKTLLLSPELLIEFLKNPTPPGLKQDGIPADATITGVKWQPSPHVGANVIELYLTSVEFTDDEKLLKVTMSRESINELR